MSKITKKSTVLISISLLIALALFSFSAIRYEQYRVRTNQHNAAVAKIASDARAAQAELDAAKTATIAKLTADKATLCADFLAYAQGKATRGLITVPAVLCSK